MGVHTLLYTFSSQTGLDLGLNSDALMKISQDEYVNLITKFKFPTLISNVHLDMRFVQFLQDLPMIVFLIVVLQFARIIHI
jgi:hypothetical protein